jgi:hypothetical protein
MDRATPARKLRRRRPASALGSAAIKAVFLVEAAIVVQRPAPRVELALPRFGWLDCALGGLALGTISDCLKICSSLFLQQNYSENSPSNCKSVGRLMLAIASMSVKG